MLQISIYKDTHMSLTILPIRGFTFSSVSGYFIVPSSENEGTTEIASFRSQQSRERLHADSYGPVRDCEEWRRLTVTELTVHTIIVVFNWFLIKLGQHPMLMDIPLVYFKLLGGETALEQSIVLPYLFSESFVGNLTKQYTCAYVILTQESADTYSMEIFQYVICNTIISKNISPRLLSGPAHTQREILSTKTVSQTRPYILSFSSAHKGESYT